MNTPQEYVAHHGNIDRAWQQWNAEHPTERSSRTTFRQLFGNAGPPLYKIAFIPDCHHPYVDRKAWALALKAIERFAPKTLVVLGDFGDFYCTSRHPKNPRRSRDLAFEVESCNNALDEVDQLDIHDKRFLLGNHENNLERYLCEKAPELFNIVSVEKLSRLTERGYKVTPYKEHDRIGKLYMTHEVGFSGERAHIQSADAMGSNVIIGHTHRLSVSYRSNLTDKHHVAISSGWLGSKRDAEYMHRSRTKDWQLGFTLGYMEQNETVHVVPVPIIDYTCIVEGQLIVA